MAARAESGQVTPWDFDLPTSTEFREMREACGMSVEEMGEEMGYSSETIRQVERGQPPGREFIQEALRTLKMEWPR